MRRWSWRAAKRRARWCSGWASRSLRIGAEIDPGVPWTYAEGSGAPMLLALKSGNFGAPDFFTKAFPMLEADMTEQDTRQLAG